MSTGYTTWKVTALLFSGRQNPEWLLTAAQQKSWMELWDSAVLNDEAVKPLPVLGYSGCTLRFDERSHWHLHNGCVSFFEDDKIVTKKDRDREMELFLLHTAAPELVDTLVSMKII